MEELPSTEASKYSGETEPAPFKELYQEIETNRCAESAVPSGEGEGHLGFADQGEDKILKMLQTGPSVADSDDNSRPDMSSKDDGERNYESEPMPANKGDYQKKMRSRANSNINSQGKTMFPRPHAVSKEMRELTRKHAILEKNLKIEGLPEPAPKFRKRRLSLSSNVGRLHDKDAPVHKRKRLVSVDVRPKRDHMPKWELMGGDAHDPLNLNGLAHSEEGRLLNLKTPESSPLRTPDFRKIVYVKVPPNIEDPLNLEGKHDQRVIDKMLNSTVKKRHRSKKKKNEDNQQVVADTAPVVQLCTVNSVEEAVMEASVAQPESQTITEGAKEQVETKATDVVVTTPTKLPLPIVGRSRSRSLSMSPERKFRRQLSGGKGKAGANEPNKFPEKPKFTLGNYNRYYGYRNTDHVPDPRLQHFDPSWFKDKDVLDIGCNVGHITLAVAEHFQPHKILGMDIDGKLIQAARQNIRHMLSLRRKDSSKYPRVFEMTRGPSEAHPLMGLSDNFPNNVLFLQGNYVPGSEEILNLQKEEFDTIMALSITKWIQLNNGDDGLKLFFQKIFRQLRPGGRLILEPQPWSTYRKRAKLTPEMFSKYQSIKLKPEGFKHYLLSIGFVKCEVIGVPVTKSRGFRRPLILFTKTDNRQTPSVVIGEVLDVRDVCQECGNTDKSLCHHPQFTGMRRGPYASLMYDHMNYPYTSSDSPYVASSRTYSNNSYSFNMPGGDDTSVPPDSDRGSDITGSCQDNGGRWVRSERTDGSRSSGSRSLISSSTSSSYESQSGSASSRSYVSSNINGSDSPWSSSSSYFSPGPNVHNGGISGVVFNPNNGQLNGDVAHEFDSSDHSGPNGEFASDYVSPELAGLVDDVIVQPSPPQIGLDGEFTPDYVSPEPVGLVDVVIVQPSPPQIGLNSEFTPDYVSPEPAGLVDVVIVQPSPPQIGLNSEFAHDCVSPELAGLVDVVIVQPSPPQIGLNSEFAHDCVSPELAGLVDVVIVQPSPPQIGLNGEFAHDCVSPELAGLVDVVIVQPSPPQIGLNSEFAPDYVSPEPTGLVDVVIVQPSPPQIGLNSEFAPDYVSPEPTGLVDVVIVQPSPPQIGLNSEFAHDCVSPEPAGLVDVVIVQRSPPQIGLSVSEEQISRHNTPAQDIENASDNEVNEPAVDDGSGGSRADVDDVAHSGSRGGDENLTPDENDHQSGVESVNISDSVNADHAADVVQPSDVSNQDADVDIVITEQSPDTSA